MSSTTELQSAPVPSPGFSVSHQKVELDIDLSARRLKGKTEITINPHSKELRTVKLNCRQCDVKRVTANGRQCPNVVYEEPYSKVTLPWEAGVHQHHMLRKKVESQLKSPPDEELIIHLPKSVKIDDLSPSTIEATPLAGVRSSVGMKDESLGSELARFAVL